MATRPSVPSRQSIINICIQAGPNNNRAIFYHPHTANPLFFVKYGSLNLLAEARTQQHFFVEAQSDPQAPLRIPEVRDVFVDGHGRAYIVMEYVPALTIHDSLKPQATSGRPLLSTKQAIDLVASAVSWLLTHPVPEGTNIGPNGGGLAQHDFFADREAPMEFSSTAALEAYINKALLLAPPQGRMPPIDLSNEPVRPCHSDITDLNFLYNGTLYMVDFQHVAMLPQSFVSYVLHASGTSFAREVSKRIH